MQLSRPTCFALAFIGLAALAPSAKATTLTGLSDFTGINPYSVAYDPTVHSVNFSAVTTSDTAAYDVYLKSDADNVYELLNSRPSAANGNSPGNNFANVYLSTEPQATLHSTIGFEVTNNNGFTPGGQSGYDLSNTGYQTFTGTGANGGHVIEFSMPWTFFTTDPLHMGFTKLLPGGTFTATGSQSFGYNFVAGMGLGTSRLGQITYDSPSAAPEPSQWAGLGFTAFGALGLILKARKKKAMASAS